MGFISDINAQFLFEEITGSNNPFEAIAPGAYASPDFADIDGDNDLDVFFALEDGTIAFYNNTGTTAQAVFELQTGNDNPLNAANGIAYAGIAFADIDGDGDSDAFISSVYAWIKYFENTGSAQQAVFEVQTGENNPLDHYEEGFEGKLDFVDIDNDNDQDVFIGDDYGSIRFYKNIGTATTPFFVQQIGSDNPLNQVYAGDFAKPAFTDLDFDGDFDLVLGVDDGSFHYFENKGTAETPDFLELTGNTNPFNGFDVGTESKPAFADLDGDGDADLIAGNENGNIRYYENLSSLTQVDRPKKIIFPDILVHNNELWIRCLADENFLLLQHAQLKLYSLNGKLVYAASFDIEPIVKLQLPTLPAGIFLLNLQMENQTKTIKISL